MPQSAALTSLLRILIESFATPVPRVPDRYQNTLPTQDLIDEVVLLPDDAPKDDALVIWTGQQWKRIEWLPES